MREKEVDMTIRDVEGAIRHVKLVIDEHEKQEKAKKLPEATTRYAIIDPILRALGWDTTNRKEVRVEYPCGPQRKPIDYALFDEGSDPLVLIEAKGLGTYKYLPLPAHNYRTTGRTKGADRKIRTFSRRSSKNRISQRKAVPSYESQLKSYAKGLQDGVGVLTDGKTWHIYEFGTARSFSRQRLAYVDISEGTLRANARTLNQLLGKRGLVRIRRGSG